MFWPTRGRAEMLSPAPCSWMSCCRLLLVLICCSTWLNETSCWVNWFVSSGDSGSWFCSCVVSSVRKVLKFCVRPVAAFAVEPDGLVEDEIEDAVAEPIGDVVMMRFLRPRY